MANIQYSLHGLQPCRKIGGGGVNQLLIYSEVACNVETCCTPLGGTVIEKEESTVG